ncbi:MAG TPA: FmdB family zinc ribbon protein [Pseudolysinimonas sp.]|nr:FmdB family zinc ribbon protein [Pseudolysinimonas sp.]
MPTYSYRCTECGEAFDIQQAFTDDTLTVCPNCDGQLRKLFNSVGVTFNGSGFYRTDSRAKPASEGGSSSDSPSGPSTSGAPSAPAAPATPAKKESKAPSNAKE